MGLRRKHYTDERYGSPTTLDDNMDWLRDFADQQKTGYKEVAKPNYEKQGGWVNKLADKMIKQAQDTVPIPTGIRYIYEWDSSQLRQLTGNSEARLLDESNKAYPTGLKAPDISDSSVLRPAGIKGWIDTKATIHVTVNPDYTINMRIIDERGNDIGQLTNQSASQLPEYVLDYEIQTAQGQVNLGQYLSKGMGVGVRDQEYFRNKINETMTNWRKHYRENLKTEPTPEAIRSVQAYLNDVANKNINNPDYVDQILDAISTEGFRASTVDNNSDTLIDEVSVEKMTQQQEQEGKSKEQSVQTHGELNENLAQINKSFNNNIIPTLHKMSTEISNFPDLGSIFESVPGFSDDLTKSYTNINKSFNELTSALTGLKARAASKKVEAIFGKEKKQKERQIESYKKRSMQNLSSLYNESLQNSRQLENSISFIKATYPEQGRDPRVQTIIDSMTNLLTEINLLNTLSSKGYTSIGGTPIALSEGGSEVEQIYTDPDVQNLYSRFHGKYNPQEIKNVKYVFDWLEENL